jgi:hypothetical protein
MRGMANKTIFDLLQDVRQAGPNGRVSKDAPSVVKGMKPKPIDTSVTGLHEFSPEYLLSLQVPTIEYTEGQEIAGFQRFLRVPSARKIARAMIEGKEMPPGLISIDEEGNPLVTDAQHRIVGAVMARKPLKLVLEHRTREAAQQLFADQKKGLQPDNDTLILSGHGPYNEYIQDAVTNPDHPWFPIAGAGKVGGKGSTDKMSPYTMKFMLVAYVGNQAGTKGGVDAAEEPTIRDRWNKDAADELAELIKAFGTKKERPEAFTSVALRATAIAATLVIARRNRTRKDIERWKIHMPKFNYLVHSYLSSTDLTDRMLDHWNKKLKTENRVQRPGR